MTVNRDDLKNVRQRRYLGADFQSMRANLLDYARQHYPDKIRDFSESSVGGMFLDFAAYVGDNLSFYLSHQYSELDPNSAVESANIERAIVAAGVPIRGAGPATVYVTVFLALPASNANGVFGPLLIAVPVIRANSIFTADNGVDFTLLADMDFNSRAPDNTFIAKISIGTKNADGSPKTFIMQMSGLCISGQETTETITIGSTFVPFRKITLSNANVTDILQVADGLGNTYYEVSSLTQDVVWRNVLNTNADADVVKDVIKVVPAPYRFITSVDLATRSTTVTFGGGNADTLEDDVIPDPTDFALELPYSTTFSRVSVDPLKLLQTSTLGVASTNTTLNITYRYGGGLNHNVQANSIKTPKTLTVFFPGNPPAAIAASVKNSIECTNNKDAQDGGDALTPDELKLLVPGAKNAQERIVSRPDIIARVYTLPSNFGRVFRAAVRSNTINPLASQLYIISRNADGKLVTSSDTLKLNLVGYLNPYRSISDAIDVLDARVVNVQVSFSVLVDPTLNKSIVLQNAITALVKLFDIKNFNIDQPISISQVRNAIYSSPGVLGIVKLSIDNVTGIVNNRTYSDIVHDTKTNTVMDMLLPPIGGIFEMRFPEVDIVGSTT